MYRPQEGQPKIMGKDNFLQRRKRVRAKIVGTKEIPRLSVFRSNKGLYVQLIDDNSGKTLIGMRTKVGLDAKRTKTEEAAELGEALAKKALTKKIKKVVFDRSGYKYHGRVATLAEGARKGGLIF